MSALKDAEKAAWDSDKPAATLFTLRRIWASGGTLYDKTDNESIGLVVGDLETLKIAVKRAIEGAK